MAEVAIVTDTTHYLPRAMADDLGLRQVSLYVNWNGRTDREADLPGFDGYYQHLRTAEDLPTTSQPSIGDFLEAYEPLLAEGRDIVSIHLSAGISGTCESARQAKAKLEEQGAGGERITVVDSQTACAGLAAVCMAAVAAVRSGAGREDVAARAEAARDAQRVWFCIDTMEFLRRGGRVGAARAWLGTTLQIKPILSLETEILPVERVRTSKRAFERMTEYLRSRHEDGADAWIVQHIQALDQAEAMVERGREIFGSEPLFVSEIGPVIGTHTGPGLLGIGGVPPALLQA